MEVRFRPLLPSTLARQVTPGKPPPHEGQGFMEVVESLNAPGQTPEQHADSGGNKEPPLGSATSRGNGAPVKEAPEETPEIVPRSSIAFPTDPDQAEEPAIGTHLDLTA